MNRLDEEESDRTDYCSMIPNSDDTTRSNFTLVESIPSVRSPSSTPHQTNIYSSKRTRLRSKYQLNDRSNSLQSSRHCPTSVNENIEEEIKQRRQPRQRRHVSDSPTNTTTTTPTSLVTSFLHYLRHQLRTTTIERQNDYHRHTRQKSSLDIPSIIMNSKLSSENFLELNDQNEILTLIDLLVLRVECLNNETKRKKPKDSLPTVSEVDQNLIEYLYYLFKKFLHEDSEHTTNISTTSMIDKNNFVHVCQTLVRNGSFELTTTSPDQSISETTLTNNSSDQTLTSETVLHEYNPEITQEKSSSIDEQDTWLVIDVETIQSNTSNLSCHLPTSPSDEQLLLSSNENDKSYESFSSPSIYLSPNSSLIDIQNMVQEIDEINHQDESTSNVSSESKTTIITTTRETLNEKIHSRSFPHILSNNDIYTRLTNDENSVDSSEQILIDESEEMSRREKKMQERWELSMKSESNHAEQSSNKPLLGIDFPPISVIRRKFSSSSPSSSSSSSSTTTTTTATVIDKTNHVEEEISTSPMTMVVDNTNPDQTNELPSTDFRISTENIVDTNDNDIQLLIQKEQTMKTKQDLLLPAVKCRTKTITNINNDLVVEQETYHMNNSTVIMNPLDSNILSSVISTSPLLISISPTSSLSSSSPSLTLTTNENDTFEPLVEETKKEKEEERKEEEQQQRCNDDYNLDEEKKNNSSLVYDYHASGILLINDEPTQTDLLGQEKKEKEEKEEERERERERASSPLPTLEQSNQQRTEDESSSQTLLNDLKPLTMTTNLENNNDDERFKKVEVEEIPDDEEILSNENNQLIEPTDYIHTDEEPKTRPTSSSPSQSSNLPPKINDLPIKFDNVLSCYEKALAKVVDTSLDESSTGTRQSVEDPIALRALQRFEQRMSAAAAATKPNKNDPNALTAKGKSSWSGSVSTPRKSLENLLKTTEQQELRPAPVVSMNEESSTDSVPPPTPPTPPPPAPPPASPPTSQTDNCIQPPKTFEDQSSNYETTLDSHQATSLSNEQTNVEEQLQPTAIIENEDKRVLENKSPDMIDSNDTMGDVFEQAVVVVEQPTITPYRFQLEGRRRLNTLERMRERRQSRESLDTTDEKQLQIQNDYTLKPEEIQDPIIRRALERFDEKNRTLTQTKSVNYDDIQDPITRRALMRLESNLKRTIPSTTSTNSNENHYTENYALGSLQSTNNDRSSRYTESSSQPPTTKYISVHQHYCTPSSTDLDNALMSNQKNESDVSVVHAPNQAIYLTSTNQPLSVRHRSRSEDMLSSRDLTIGQTTNLDDVDTSSQLQRNRSSNELALNEPNKHLPNALIKILEPNFVRTTESSVTYVTPTQTYSAYSCEYTRPRRNQTITPSESSSANKQETNQLTSSRYSQQQQQQQQQQQDDIQRPTPYRSIQTSSSFTPLQPSTSVSTTNNSTTTSNYYGQQPISSSSYSSTYTSNNVNQSPYSDDPIVRRALERFNSQMQSTYPSVPQYQSNNNYLPRQENFPDSYLTSNRPTLMTTSMSSTNSGYQSIIGRRRQARHDDLNNYFIDNPSVGDAYSSSLFGHGHNSYPIHSHYMNMPDEPPAIPPRYRRTDDNIDHYRRHSTDEYLSDNVNTNNNNNSQTLPRNAFIHHAYPATITNASGFRPITTYYNPLTSEQDEFHDQRYEQRLPSSNVNERRTHEPINSDRVSPNQSSIDATSFNNGDSVFHRLAYTGTRASLSRSSSNSCSNLLNKNSPQNPSTQLKPCEIDFEDTLTNTTITDQNNESTVNLSSTNKYQRSKSVDTRTRLKFTPARTNNETDENHSLNNDDQQRIVPSSKFTPVHARPPPRVPLTPRSSLSKRSSNGVRTPNSNGNFYQSEHIQQDFENEENISINDDHQYQTKLIDNRTRTTIPVHRYTTNNNNNNNNNHIQSSPSTSSVNSNMSRAKPPVSMPMNLDRRDSNGSMTDTNRTSRRFDDNRLVSPTGQRRNIPVSVFSTAKLDNKRPAPVPPAHNYESQQGTSYLTRLTNSDQTYTTKSNNDQISSLSAPITKTPTGNLLKEYSPTPDKTDTTKKMNVFERLFRGNKKKT